MPNPPASPADKSIRSVEKGLAVALALAVGGATYKALCSALRCASAGFGLPFLFLACMAGLIALGIFLVQAEDSRDDWLRRLAVNGAALFVIFVLWVLPNWQSGQAGVERKAEQRAERVLSDNHQQKADEAWRAGLLSNGDHGPPGMIPPMLRVEPGDGGVVVTNTSQHKPLVSLARVRPDAAVPGGWRACAMHTAGKSGGSMRYFSFSLDPGARATFVNLETCAEAFKDALIEYRVGQYPSEMGWWSDSALASPGSREFSDGK